MDDTPFVPVGRVVKAHGIKGEVSVAYAVGPPFELPPGCSVWIVPPTGLPGSLTVEGVRQGPKGPLIKLSGISDRSAANALRGRTILVEPGTVPCEIPGQEADVTGSLVYDETRGLIGAISETILTGANDVWVVDGERFGQVLVPVIDEVVLSVDLTARTVHVALLPGLIEEAGT